MLLGVVIGWFFGMLIATAYAVSARYRGYVDAERSMREMEREVERDERLARWHRA